MRQYLKRSWDYIIIEPFTWLFFAYFQSTTFATTYERERITQRIGSMFRLALPLFLTFYIFMLFVRLIRVVLFDSNLIYIYNPFPIDRFFVPTQSVFLTIALGLIFILVGGIQFGITFCIGTGIAFTLLSILIRSFYPAESNLYPLSYSFPSNLLTGFAIGILFATAFAITDETPIQIRKGIIRGIGFGIVLFVILQHLENADFQDLWDGITSLSNSSGITSGIIGCVIAGIALSVAGDIIIDSSADFSKSFDRMIVRGLTGGIVFAITFAFVLILIPPYDNSNNYANDINNLSMVSILLGFIGGFLASMKGTFIKWLTIIIGIIIVGALIGSTSYNSIFSFPILKTISSSTSPFSFMYQAILSLAFGFVGGSLSSNKDWRTLTWICIVIFLLELVNLLVGRLANIFVVTYEPGIISSIMGGLVAGMITGLVIVFLKNIDRGLARGIIFTIATVIAAISLGFAKFDSSAYTDIRTAITIGIGCFVGYVLVYYRIHLYHSPKRALPPHRCRRRRIRQLLLQRLYRMADLKKDRRPGRNHLRAAIKWSIIQTCIVGSTAPTSVVIPVAMIASGRPLQFQLASTKLPLPTGGIPIPIRRRTSALITSLVVCKRLLECLSITCSRAVTRMSLMLGYKKEKEGPLMLQPTYRSIRASR